MKLCFDADVIVDMLAAEGRVADAVFCYDIANLREYDTCMSAGSVAEVAASLRSRGLGPAEAEEATALLFELFDVIDLTAADCRRACDSSMDSFARAAIAESSARYGIDLIITNDSEGFAASSVPVMTPGEFVDAYMPAGYTYMDIDLAEDQE